QYFVAVEVFSHRERILRISSPHKQRSVLFFGTHDGFVSVTAQQTFSPLEFPMYLRTILFLTLVLFCASTALAQRPGPEFWRKVGCEPFEPRTKLEAIDDRHGAVIIKAFTRITTIEVRGVRIDA